MEWFERIKFVGKLIIKYWWVILILLFGIQNWRLLDLKNKLSQTIEGKQQEIAKLSDELKITQDDLAAIKVQGGRVIILTRTVPGGQVGGGQAPYVPPEGYVLVRVKKDKPPEIIIKNKGFTFKPGIGIIYSGKLLPEADLKFAYWVRWSGKTGINLEFVNAGISRHIDDFPFCSKFNNIELQGVFGMAFQGGWRFGVGLRSNL